MNIYVTPDRRIKANNKIIGTSGESGTVRFDFKFPQFIEETSTELFSQRIVFRKSMRLLQKDFKREQFCFDRGYYSGGMGRDANKTLARKMCMENGSDNV